MGVRGHRTKHRNALGRGIQAVGPQQVREVDVHTIWTISEFGFNTKSGQLPQFVGKQMFF
jgi:hypothetical protein